MTLAEKIFSISLVKLAWYKLALICTSKNTKLVMNSGRFRSFIWGEGERSTISGKVPKVIWSYWGGELSECAEACRQSWESHRNDFDIRILTAETINNFLPDFPALPKGIPEQKKSNLIRLMLLERYGGIWMDYSTVLMCPLDWIVDLVKINDCEMMAFYNEFHDEYKADHDRPIIENGFIAANVGSKFIADWRSIYQDCIQSRDYREFFRSRPDFDQLTDNFLRKERDYIDYFVCYIAAQYVMANSKNYRIFLINAEDEYYFFSYHLNPPRSRRKFAEELLLRECTGDVRSRLIKVTGRHRSAIDEHIKHGCYRRDSIIGSRLNFLFKSPRN